MVCGSGFGDQSLGFRIFLFNSEVYIHHEGIDRCMIERFRVHAPCIPMPFGRRTRLQYQLQSNAVTRILNPKPWCLRKTGGVNVGAIHSLFSTPSLMVSGNSIFQYSPPEVNRIWLWVYYKKIPIYPCSIYLRGTLTPKP